MKHPVEVKVTLRAGGAAAQELGLGVSSRRTIWFLEDTADIRALPLFQRHVILRLRSDEHGSDDSTVKLRPCDPDKLPTKWSSPREWDDIEYRIEGDWTPSQQTSAASCEAKLQSGTVENALAKKYLRIVFAADQLDFLSEACGVAVDIDALRPLGPVNATRWKDLIFPDLNVKGKVAAERWVVGHLDFLELSLRVKRSRALEEQQALEYFLQQRGFTIPADQLPKTTQVLRYLAVHDERPPEGGGNLDVRDS
jgi:hypothetical protein